MSGERAKAWRWTVCGLILLATMLNYMDRQTLSQSATDIGQELRLSNEDYGKLEQGFGLAFALGGLVLGFVADRVSLRWLYPAVLLAWSATGFATSWAEGFNELLVCRVLLGFFEAGQWPCALAASQRLLSRSDRALGNSVIQSGASIGAVLTPLVVQAMVTDAPGSWRGPFRVIGLLGAGWAMAWLLTIRRGDLDRVAADSPRLPETTTTSRAMFVRRFLVLAIVVVAINLCWHFYRAWLPKMLREQYHVSRSFANYFTSLFYIATDVGCLGAGLAVKGLTTRGWTVHRARIVTFLGCGALTALGALTTVLPPGWLTLGLFLLVGAGALGMFPIYYSLTQELSARHQGKVTGALGCIAWLSSALMHWQVGRWVDRTGSYGTVLVVSGLLPLAALVVLALLWDRRSAAPAVRPAPLAEPVPGEPPAAAEAV
jgi:ACS family hexuronate transporter-like MFS transporter